MLLQRRHNNKKSGQAGAELGQAQTFFPLIDYSQSRGDGWSEQS